MPKKIKNTYTLNEVSEITGITPRTLRFYISRGLLPGPGKAGRGAQYTVEHIDRLGEIQSLQSQGLTLAGIARHYAKTQTVQETPQTETWRHYRVAEDVAVLVREDAGPWRLKSIQEAISSLQKELKAQEKRKKE